MSFVLLAMTGCKDKVKGVLDLNSGVSLIEKDKYVYVPAGRYNSELKLEKKKATLKIETAQDKYKFKFKHPYKKSLGENFNVFIDSQASKQPVDVALSRTTIRDNSDNRLYYETRSCQEYVRVGRIEIVTDRRGNTRQVCRYVSQSVRGEEEISYYRILKTEQTNVDMYQQGSRYRLGGMDATERSYERDIVRVGRCHVRHVRHECGGRRR